MRLAAAILGLLFMIDPAGAQELMKGRDLLALPQPRADTTLAYGPAPQQVVELRVPKGPGPHPVLVLVHGGCWEAPWGFDHLRSLASALTAEGWATWSLEYRRLGDEGGGWPGTLDDVARGADHLRAIAGEHRLDLDRVAAVGHSAGGQLALWLAARHRLPAGAPGRAESPLRLRGVVGLAAITDLEAGARDGVCGDAIPRVLGGATAAVPERAAAASPIRLLPLGVPVCLVHGARDAIVPIDQARGYQGAARAAGDAVSVDVVPGTGHFEAVNPASAAWTAVLAAVRSVMDAGAR